MRNKLISRIFRKVVVLMLCIALLFTVTSCLVLVGKDKGKHKGWFKNPKNPHNPRSTKPRKGKGKHNELSGMENPLGILFEIHSSKDFQVTTKTLEAN